MDERGERLVVIGDRRHLVGDALASLLNRHGYVALATPQVDIAIKEAGLIGAHLAIIDVDPPSEPMLDILRDARVSGYSVPVLAVADAPDLHVRRQVLLAGARAIVGRALPTGAFLGTVECLCRGETVLPALHEPAPGGRLPRRGPWLELTSREIEILLGLVAGSSTGELAERFGLRHATIRTYVQRVLMKLGVHSRSAAVAVALQAGLLPPHPMVRGFDGGGAVPEPRRAAATVS